jgi:colanic acid biosynthesis glycosyl transferase WcaI
MLQGEVVVRIIIHDFSGHPFQVQLSRTLAKLDHTVLHLYSASFQTPKGNLLKNAEDPATFNIKGIHSAKEFNKYSYIKRIFQEMELARKFVFEISEFNPDVVISSNAPLVVQKAIQQYCRRNNCKFIFWLQDLYGIAIYNILKNQLFGMGRLVGIYFKWLEANLLSKSDKIIVITDDFRTLLIDKYKIVPYKIHTIPNWAPIDEIGEYAKSNDWSRKHNYQDKFCIVYSGTLGLKHNPSLILEAALAFRNHPDVIVVVISEGLGASWLDTEKQKHGLSNINIMNFLPFEVLPLALSTADILIGILEKSAGVYSVPSKVLTYHCVGKPLVLAVPKVNLAARIVSDYKTGLVVEPDDPKEFVDALELLYIDSKLRNEFGSNARHYAEEFFDVDKIAAKFLEIISH